MKEEGKSRRRERTGARDEAKDNVEGGNGSGAQGQAQAPFLTAAERLMQRRGWHLFLLDAQQKKPLEGTLARTGVRWGATPHFDVLRANYNRLMRQYAHIGLGVPTGVDNNIFALELDTPEGHAERDDAVHLAKLEAEHGKLPSTLTTLTPTGSRHLYFKLPPRYGVDFRLKNKLGPIEVKGEGHYLVAPPTLRPGYDVPYRWIDEDAAIVEAPEWLLELITAPTTADEGGGEYEDAVDPDLVAATVACIPNNDAEYDDWIAVGMGIKACVADEEIAFAIWYAWSDQSEKNNKERNTAAVWKTLKPTRSGYGALVNRARRAHPDWEDRMFYLEDELAQHVVRFTTTALGVIESGKPPNWLKEDAGRGVGLKGKWQAPAPEDDQPNDQPKPEDDQPGTPDEEVALIDPWDRYIVPPFPIDVLPTMLQDHIGAQAEIIGSDPACIAMSVLATFSGALDHRFALKMMRMLRAASNPATVGDPNWASALAREVIDDTIAAAASLSAAADVIVRGMRVNFDSAGSIRIPGRSFSANNADAGNWVGEGQPIPVKPLAFTDGLILEPRKLAVIVVFTTEQAASSAIEVIARAMISEAVGLALDATMFDNVAGDTTRPPGLLNGVTPLAAATGGGGIAAAATDIGNLIEALANAHGGKTPLFIMAPNLAASLKLFAGPKWDYPIVVSASLAAGEIIAIELASFVSAFGAEPQFDTVKGAMFHYDTVPAADPMTAAPTRELFQTDQIGLRMILQGAWGLRAAGHVQYIAGASW